MVRGSLFEGLPPPAPCLADSSTKAQPKLASSGPSILGTATSGKRLAAKSDHGSSKRVRFQNTEVKASEELILEAIGKIASHVGNPDKFSKASKLALQLLQAGSLKPETADAFFEILRAAMATPSQAIDAKLWTDYHALFSAVLEKVDLFVPAQQAQIGVWELWAILANEFRTDDTFVFSRASTRLRQLVSALPDANEDNFVSTEAEEGSNKQSKPQSLNERDADNPLLEVKFETIVENDPFGLNALMPRLSKKEEKARRKKDEEAANLQAQKVTARLLKERREAIITCLKVAAEHYRLQWAQTIIDILLKHAFDSVVKFTVPQRDLIGKLWGSIREQLTYRKQGKSTWGKLDVTPFEHLQSQYAREHISIRRAVGSSGERSAEQWLG